MLFSTAVRALDNVIDLNYYPIALCQNNEPSISSHRFRNKWLSSFIEFKIEHVPLKVNNIYSLLISLYEKINYYTLEASCQLAKEKGSYAYCSMGVIYDNRYFILQKRHYHSSSVAKTYRS